MGYIGTNYPKEVAEVVRDQTLSINSELFLARAAEGDKPLKVYNDFSRFVFTIISSGKALKANVPVEEIEEMRERTRIAHSMHIKAPFVGQNRQAIMQEEATKATELPGLPKTPGATYLFPEFGGRSAAKVLMEEEGGEALLNRLFKSLDKEKEPEKVQAILDAARLKKEGFLTQKPKTAEKLSLASSVKIANGNLKGKTPLEVLSEEKGEEKLLSQRAWLAKSVVQYPNNQGQIDAIDAALELKKLGMNQASGSATPKSADGSRILIYEALYRPLVRKTNENGKAFVYEIVVAWNIGAKYPVSITITNYWAPVRKDEKGLLNVVAKEAENRQKAEMLLLSKEWNNILRAVETNMRQFEAVNALEVLKDAYDADKRNREAAATRQQDA